MIIQLARFADGTRKIVEIVLLASHGRETFRIASLARYDAEPMGADGKVKGDFHHLAVPRRAADRLHMVGEIVPPLFGIADEDDQLTTREAV